MAGATQGGETGTKDEEAIEMTRKRKATVAMLQEQCREARSALIEIQTVIRASLERL
jgi:hypothetical protein